MDDHPPNNTNNNNNDDETRRSSLEFTAPVVGHVSFGTNWERRKQTMAMFSCSLYFLMPMVLWCWIVALVLLFNPLSALPIACYLGHVFLLDQSPRTGARRPWLRGLKDWWEHSCDYLPLLLVKTAALDSDQNQKYVLGYHPHGIISVGCFGAFATDGARTLSLVEKQKKQKDKDANDDDDDKKKKKKYGTLSSSSSAPVSSVIERGFSSLFPGLERHVVTLPQNFYTPFTREYFLSMGAVTSDKATFRQVLDKPGAQALVVVVGGAAESMMAHKGRIDLMLLHRRGFVREAIMANASLVPVIGFGENDLYQTNETEEKPWIQRLQGFVKRRFGFGMPIFRGRSMFFKDFGAMPHRKPVVVVVGAPIPPPPLDSQRRREFCPLVDRETDQALNEDGKLVLEWHAKYIKGLQELYETHKDAEWNFPGQDRLASMRMS